MSLAAIPLRPPLREGDRLTSAEFLRRWDAMPELKHAELIDGVVFMSSPVSLSHGNQQVNLSFWLRLYTEQTPGCSADGDATWIMGPKNVPQPDISLRILPEYGGQSTVDRKYGGGAPELIVEVTGSSSSRDLGVKLDLYRRVGVREYITVLLPVSQVIWRQLVRGRYKEIAPEEDGLLHSRVFPGLWLDPAAVWDPKRSLRTAVEKGMRSPEHAAFVRRLAAHKRK
jgi:Uma2 family endonuclease